MKKNVCQGHTASTDCLCINSGNAPHSASLDKPTRGFPGSDPRSATREPTRRAELSPGPVDNPLSTLALNDHAEAMRNETVARLVAERYSFPRWFAPARPVPDNETAQAARRRLMAADFEALDNTVVEIA